MQTQTASKPYWIEWVCVDFEAETSKTPITLCVDHFGDAKVTHGTGPATIINQNTGTVPGEYTFTGTGTDQCCESGAARSDEHS